MKLRLALGLAVAGLAAGCALLTRPRLIPTRYYSISPSPPEAPAGKTAPVTLAVRFLTAPSRYRERILYRKSETVVGHREGDRWVEPPDEMVTTALVQALQAAKVADVVLEGRLLPRADVVLEGSILRFDEVQGRDQWEADFAIELVLKTDEGDRLLLAERFPARQPAKERTTAAFVEAMSAATAEALGNATKAVAKALEASAAKRKADAAK